MVFTADGDAELVSGALRRAGYRPGA
jgi:hypothetical protein